MPRELCVLGRQIQYEGGGAVTIETFVGPVKWQRADR
jgi:hypothetical protein